MNRLTASIVVGFHECTPAAPEEAVRAELCARVAVVIDPALTAEHLPDYRLYLACLRAISACLSADKDEVLTVIPERRGWFTKFQPASEQVIGSIGSSGFLLGEESELPDKVRWWRRSTLVAVATTEPWWRVGGPDVYHDSETLSCFLAARDTEQVVAAVRTAVRGAGGETTDLIRAAESPVSKQSS